MPISTTIESTKAIATSGGPQTSAIHWPPVRVLNCWKISTIAASNAWSAGTAIAGAARAIRRRRGSWRLAMAKKESSQKETNTIERWNGQNFHDCATSTEYSVSPLSEVTSGLPVACAHRIEVTSSATTISGKTTHTWTYPCV